MHQVVRALLAVRVARDGHRRAGEDFGGREKASGRDGGALDGAAPFGVDVERPQRVADHLDRAGPLRGLAGRVEGVVLVRHGRQRSGPDRAGEQVPGCAGK
ncbi:hypothetical protein ACFV2X_42970 [Streptomyces sp. NPDC059679]|uniref:hypothetical protein n=1 Tax=Streptomyces sp. NPDC059679 TaxID=3346903 RepID=UPI0036AE6108